MKILLSYAEYVKYQGNYKILVPQQKSKIALKSLKTLLQYYYIEVCDKSVVTQRKPN